MPDAFLVIFRAREDLGGYDGGTGACLRSMIGDKVQRSSDVIEVPRYVNVRSRLRDLL